MSLLYFARSEGNFGDDLNPEIWPRLFPSLVETSDRHLIAIGSILTDQFDEIHGVKHVLGSGCRSKRKLPDLTRDYDIRCVRGPLTAEALGLPSTKVATDAAAAILRFFPAQEKRNAEVGFMPHYHSLSLVPWDKICAWAGVTLISPQGDCLDTLKQIQSVDRLITEAMHGAIVADLYRVPWCRVRISSFIAELYNTADFKWSDWAQSVAVDPSPSPFPVLRPRTRPVMRAAYRLLHTARIPQVVTALRRLKHAGDYRLSPPQVLEDACNRFNDATDHLMHDLKP